ncbi:HET-like protein [Stemphylium lycopersici]|uniref:HET-like protein n=1 Tax=Stemphylium lycopersici TaxID=183478 RepID=A0A364MYV0_STELY|nr:HET-like protein [Stemphylium lycopersici]
MAVSMFRRAARFSAETAKPLPLKKCEAYGASSTTSTAVQEAPQIQTSTTEAPPPPPPPPPPPVPSSTRPATSAEQPAEQPTAAPTTSSTEAATEASSTGTSNVVPISSSARVTPLALASSGPATAAEEQPPAAEATVQVPSQVAVVSPAPSTSQTPTSSDPVSTAVPSSLVLTSKTPTRFTAPAVSDAPTTVDTSPELPIETDTEAQPSITDSLPIGDISSTASLQDASPSGGSAGIIAPDQGSPGDDSPLTLNGNGNIGGIIGGVFGGIAALALISGLLFFCLRKRKSQPRRWDEKRQDSPSFMEKLRAIPTGMGGFIARLKGSQAGPIRNPYQRHNVQNSTGSIYSRDSSGRIRSNSEPQGAFGINRTGSKGSISSRKSERNLLRKKPSSVSSYRFPGIIEDTGSPNPFADPHPPNTLFLLNSDPKSTPVTPQVPAATASHGPRDPFASALDPPMAGPAWQNGPSHTHQRTMSSMSALSSHPPLSLYFTEDPFRDPRNAPPMPNQAVLPHHSRRRSSMALPTFNALSTFDATSTFASRDSDVFFGEPGPSRPATNMFTPAMPTGRTVRQSDPFDLDRPEVLGFGSVVNRREVRGSVTRQATRNKRTSSVGNWGNTASNTNSYGLYPRESAKPPPLAQFGKR